MVDAATEFKKSGFSEQDSADLALVASMYQNIADEQISAGEAANFLVSQMKAFNFTADDAQHIIDAVYLYWPLRGELSGTRMGTSYLYLLNMDA